MISDPGPSRDALVAQIEALRGVVQRQQLLIGSMRESHFWKLRDQLVGLRTKLFGTPDPLPKETPTEEVLSQAARGDAYQLFRLRHRRSEADAVLLDRLVPLLSLRDRIGIIIDARAAEPTAIDDTVASLRRQIFTNWVAHVWIDPARGDQARCLTSAAAGDERIAPLPWDGITVNSADAVGCVDAGDLLEAEALLFIALELAGGADVVYTDEDRLGPDGTCSDPEFKPDWSPETELTRDYVGRLCVIRTSALGSAGGLDLRSGTAMWYDAVLRVTDLTDRVAHVPQVLYHRRRSRYVADVSDIREVLDRTLARRGELARVRVEPPYAFLEFTARGDERVAVIIPTRDRSDLLERCLSSLFERTSHAAFDVIVVDNGSTESPTRDLLEHWKKHAPGRFRVIRDDLPFNYSRLNNAAVRISDAPYVVLLNNDTEIVSPTWMTAMLGQARRKPIGAVGALLMYEDRTVQHAGVILGGVLGLAGHAYRNLHVNGSPPVALRYDTNYLAVTGACLMVAREKYLEVDGLDESLAVAYNDVDFCLKLRRAGYRNVVVPGAQLYHYESKSRGADDTREKLARALDESMAIRRRWTEWSIRDPYYNPNLTLNAEDFSVRL